MFGDTPEVRQQKLAFRDLLEAALRERGIQFVAEEWGLPRQTTAHILANEHGIPWANINTSIEDLNRMGIPHNYIHGDYSPEDKNRWHRQREKSMFQRVLELGDGANRVMVICGFNHVEPISELFRAIGLPISIVDYRQFPWYRPGVFAED